MKKVNKHYVSPIDEQLEAFNQSHPLSQSQRDEIAKYQKISQQRDRITPNNDKDHEKEDDIWK